MEQPLPKKRLTAASASQKIAKLQQTFLEQLPQRVEQAQAALADLSASHQPSQAIETLHQLLHNIKGTGRSLGFAEIGHCAEQCEALLAAWPSLAQQELHHGVQRLQELVEKQLQQRVGAGAMGFVLTVPEDQHSPVAAQPLVYLCDDEEFMLEQLTAQLACFGYRAQGFTDPQSLRQAFLQRRPDAVVMDIHFPQGAHAGIDTLRALKQEVGESIPAIFLSSHNDFAVRLGAVQAGGQAYLVKPVPANALVKALDTITRKQQPEPYRVLIVDDEPTIASYHALMLQQAGMLTQELHDPRQVLQMLQQFRPDLVLMDMYMPHCSGKEVAEVIRQDIQYVGLPIVYLTAETDRHKLLSAMQIGVEGYLSKPVDAHELVTAVAIRAERMRTLRSLMARDSLTGLFNHTMTTQLLENALAQTGRNGSKVCFAMLDIDHFKAVNDSYGHPVGDQVLIALARILQQRLRSTDMVGRYGGEEFAIILHNEDLQASARLIDTLRQDFAKVSFFSGHQEFHCTFSAGIAQAAPHQRIEALRDAADQALYQAKKQGRNCVVAAPMQHHE